MPLSEDYLGNTIIYCEETNDWVCLSRDVVGKSLKSVKSVLAKRDADERRVRTPGLKFKWTSAEPCVITLVSDNRQYLWIERKGQREKVPLNMIAFDTPENREVFARAEKHTAEAKASEQRARDLLLSIPRVTLDVLLAREKETV